MGKATDFFEQISQIEPFDLESEYVIALRDGDEAPDNGHYVVREHEVGRSPEETPPQT